ncbi:putative reverse transcriptase domain-containing protein [Tanacetum coccineum]
MGAVMDINGRDSVYLNLMQLTKTENSDIYNASNVTYLKTSLLRIMPPRESKKKKIKKLVEIRVAKAIKKYKKCVEGDKFMFAASTFEGHALTWWNGNVHTLGLVNANRIPWNKFKSMMTTEYYPTIEIQRMEEELWTLTLKGDDIEAYNNRFHELALMCPELVPTEKKKIKRYIKGFPKRIKGNITFLKPTTLHEAINMARDLVEQLIQGKAARVSKSNKRKAHHQLGPCPAKYGKYGRLGHQEKDCQVRCPKGRHQRNEGSPARAYVIGTENPQQNPNVVTSTFLLNDHYASILFDSGAEKSFVSTEFTPFINIAPATLDTSYEVEFADGKVASTNIVLRGCTLALYKHCFKINLLPTGLESFDVIVGMYWLSYHRGVIVCYKKIVCIPLPNGETLEIQGERPEKDPKLLSCIKTDEKKPKDIRIIRDFSKVFPNDLSGLPPVHEIEFCFDLILGALPVVKSPYRLAPSEMMEL